MGRARHGQRDLFQQAPQATELRPELRSRIARLLQTLLAEACVAPQAADTNDRSGEEDGDDQDHA